MLLRTPRARRGGFSSAREQVERGGVIGIDLPKVVAGRHRAVTFRSLLIGLVGVVAVCAFTPFNDWVLKNTPLASSFLPLGAMLFALALVLGVNAPLSRFRPRWALSCGELAVAFSMTLVVSTLPGRGFMTLVPGPVVAFAQLPSVDVSLRDRLVSMNLPDWIFPSMAAAKGDVMGRAQDPAIQYFLERIPPDEHAMGTWWRVYRAWLRPAATWGALLICLYGAVVLGATLVRRQWVENERLPFPLAGVYLALLEPPAAGRALNGIFRSRGFWLAAAAVFAAHLINGLNVYDGAHFPKIPLDYSLTSLFPSPPWASLPGSVQATRIYFVAIGITFFLQSQTAFSLWFFVILLSGEVVAAASVQTEFTLRLQGYQCLGAMVPLTFTILWIGRKHWAVIVRRMVGRARDGDVQGLYLPYGPAAWGLLACLAGLFTWLLLAGASVLGAAMILIFFASLYVVVAKVVAQTGLIAVFIPIDFGPPCQLALTAVYGPITQPAVMKPYFFTSFFNYYFVQSLRESLSPFATHALRVADGAAEVDGRRSTAVGEEVPGRRPSTYSRRPAIAFIAALALALVVGYGVAGTSALWTEYHYSSSLDERPESPINSWATQAVPASLVTGLTQGYVTTGSNSLELNRWITHVSIGMIVTTVLAVLRLRFAWWPLDPIGFLLAPAGQVQAIWLSLFLGWAAKVIVLKLGGATLYQKARPVFIGLIIGEVAAAGGWLLVSVVCAANGWTFHAISIMPN